VSASKIALLGLDWWGPGPSDFAAAAREHDVSAVVMANLRSPVDRRILNYRAASDVLVGLRVGRRIVARTVIVTSPHRLPERTLLRAKKRSRVVAWLGDAPVGERAFQYSPDLFDLIFAADPRWLEGSHALPWPHLVPDSLQTAVPSGRSEVAVIVGTPYERRVALAREVVGEGLQLVAVGGGWPTDIHSIPSMPRLRTLEWLKEARAVVVNVPHEQMRRTLNPFFFDVAAAGVPQLYVGEPDLAGHGLSGLVDMRLQSLRALMAATDRSRERELQRSVLSRHSMDSRLKELLR